MKFFENKLIVANDNINLDLDSERNQILKIQIIDILMSENVL